jgi:parallel beta-helix repeat protein
VYEGSYSEILTINHKIDLFGEDKDLATITGSDSGDRITISAENVNISHFTIQNCGSGVTNAVIKINSGHTIVTDNIIESGGKHGISINNCDNNIIYDNTIRSNSGNGINLNHSDSNSIAYNSITSNSNNGMFLYNSSYNTIENNAAIKSNTYSGIFLNETSNYNNITYNNFSSNTKNGIFLNDHCDHNTLSDNDIYSNSASGIRIENSSSQTVSNNVINGNDDYGIILVGSNSTIQSNTINYNELHGIYLFGDDNNIILSNTIRSNTYDGIRLSNSTNDIIHSNEISDNSRYGINLDYFTMNNLIYNNYFHDNTDNAVDKSINYNTWNITKTSGTNKVGGSYKCGNYWDDFDETSEGATDTDGDGISSNSYTIYASNKDYGPLLDVIPPTVGTPQVSPSTQSIGGYTYISVTVADYIEVKEVYLDITDPNSQTSNFSILQNKTGDTYYCNKKYSTVGDYTFHLAAKDPRNWEISSTGTFYIDQGSPPTITDNNPATGSPSTIFTFNASAVDDADSSSDLTVKVIWSHGDKGGNYSMINVYGNYFEMNTILDNSIDPIRYKFYASDQWGNSYTTTQKTVKIIDNKAPEISIVKYGSSLDVLVNSYTFGATITDDHEVNDVTIEYWYDNTNHKTVEMDKKSNNYYEKVIIINENPNRVKCIIYATDPSGNQNDTKKPFADIGGPYNGVIGIEPEFDASNSFDLDGNITEYLWDFGDGTTGTGETTGHVYTTNGNYTITLTITDNDGNKDTNVTYVKIISLIQQKTSNSTMNEIEDEYGVTLSDLFYCYDTDGDELGDIFVDPNNVLTAVHSGNIDINGNIVFLLSIDDADLPEFMWNSTTDEILPINSEIQGSIKETNIDEANSEVTTIVNVNKIEGWIYLKVETPNIDDYGEITGLTSATKDGVEIDEDKIIQKSDVYYVLDDPETEYQFIFSYQPLPLTPPEFIPPNGTINENNPTIKIVFNIAVEITYADFYNIQTQSIINIISNLVTSDNIIFYYTPPSNLENGEYEILVRARSLTTNVETENSTVYSFIPYEVIKKELNLFQFVLLISIIGAAGAIILLLIKYKIITFGSFIYIKNNKIIPFFKPLIIGPLRIDVNDEKVKKAEFYVNGELKDILTKAPFVWDWNEPAFMKKTIETKIYDEDGNKSSSGEMTFFVFNSPRLFK